LSIAALTRVFSMRTRVEQICDGDGADCHDEPVDVDRRAPQDVTAP